MKNQILVTGGTGYIGSHTVVELLYAGYDVIIIDNLSNSDRNMLERIKKITGKSVAFENIDLKDKDALNDFFNRNNQIEGVIHFAALKSVGESVEKPVSYYENNVYGTVNLLDNIINSGIKHLIFSSSATVYGSPERLPVDENTPIGKTDSPYGYSKQVCERMIDDVVKTSDSLSAISLRYFNPIGAHHSHEIGELPSGIPNNLMPYITQTAAGVREKLYVFGNDYNTPDGTAVRDYIHVSDVATAHVKALDYLFENNADSGHEYINIGRGEGYSVLQVVKSFEKTSGLKLNYDFAERRKGDVESIYADVSLAASKLGWKAQYTLDDMTASAWAWEKRLRGL